MRIGHCQQQEDSRGVLPTTENCSKDAGTKDVVLAGLPTSTSCIRKGDGSYIPEPMK